MGYLLLLIRSYQVLQKTSSAKGSRLLKSLREVALIVFQWYTLSHSHSQHHTEFYVKRKLITLGGQILCRVAILEV